MQKSLHVSPLIPLIPTLIIHLVIGACLLTPSIHPQYQKQYRNTNDFGLLISHAAIHHHHILIAELSPNEIMMD